MPNINYLLKSKRVAINKTQTEIAEYIGLKKSSYAMKENGIRGFSTEEIEKLSILFKLSCEEIVQIFLPKSFTQTEQK